mgnify:FL=1
MKKHFNSRLHHYVFILTLVVFSLIGVGFSSYLIEGNNNSGKGDVNINVGEVNGLYSDAISVDTSKANNGIEPLYYTDKGFISKDSSSKNEPNGSSKGYFNIYFIFDIKLCRNYFKDYNSLFIEFNLSTSDQNKMPISNFNLTNLSISSNDDFFTYQDKIVKSNEITTKQNYIKAIIRLDNALRNFSDIFNGLTYIEIAPINSNRYSNIYNFLKDEDSSFNLSIGLGGYNA